MTPTIPIPCSGDHNRPGAERPSAGVKDWPDSGPGPSSHPGMRLVFSVSPRGTEASASRNRLPAGVALRYVGVVSRRIGAVVPVLRGAGLAGAVVVIVRIVIRSIWIVSPSQTVSTPPPAIPPVVPAMVPVAAICMVDAIVETGEATAPSNMEAATVKAATVKPTKSTPAVKPSASAVPRSVGEIWLAQRSNAQQRSGSAPQSPSSPRLGSIHA
jgi:hypothetical protein